MHVASRLPLRFGLLRRIKAHAAGRTITPSGRSPSCPRHGPCCGCATACASLLSQSWFRFLLSLFLRRDRRKLYVGGQSEPGQPPAKAGLSGRLIPSCWNVHDSEIPLLPAIEGGAGETSRPGESSGTPAVSAAAATGMTGAAKNDAAVVELLSCGPWRAG